MRVCAEALRANTHRNVFQPLSVRAGDSEGADEASASTGLGRCHRSSSSWVSTLDSHCPAHASLEVVDDLPVWLFRDDPAGELELSRIQRDAQVYDLSGFD